MEDERSPQSIAGLVWLFNIRKWTPFSTLDFTVDVCSTFADIMHNCPAGTLIAKVGLPYIGSLAWQSGLYHEKRGGLWLKAAYCEKGSWSSPVAAPHTANATALSVATYFTLLAQGRLVDDASSAEIRTALFNGCVATRFPRLPVVASKCGIWKGYAHDCAWIQDSEVRYVMAVMSKLETKQQAALYTDLCTEIDALVRKKNKGVDLQCAWRGRPELGGHRSGSWHARHYSERPRARCNTTCRQKTNIAALGAGLAALAYRSEACAPGNKDCAHQDGTDCTRTGPCRLSIGSPRTRMVKISVQEWRAMMAIRYEDGSQLGTSAGVRRRAQELLLHNEYLAQIACPARPETIPAGIADALPRVGRSAGRIPVGRGSVVRRRT